MTHPACEGGYLRTAMESVRPTPAASAAGKARRCGRVPERRTPQRHSHWCLAGRGVRRGGFGADLGGAGGTAGPTPGARAWSDAARDALRGGLGEPGAAADNDPGRPWADVLGPAPFGVSGFPSTWGQVGVAKSCADARPSKCASPNSAFSPHARSPTPEWEPRRIRPPSLPAGIEPDVCCD
jgi:hypothetical protein